ncbi:MAG: AAA-like domain-containing protein [Fimbriimonadales bacterium]
MATVTPLRESARPYQGGAWHVNLLGRLEVVSSSNEVVRFRSRTAASLLAFLALNKHKERSNDVLQEMFWPDSDCDRQAQNLRRAVADLRQVLEAGRPLGSVLVTRRSFVSLNPVSISTDVERFTELTSRASGASDGSLYEALALYAGPLLAPLHDSWILSERMGLEESFAQLVVQACSQKADSDSIRIARTAVAAAPLREDIHIALIAAYRRADMEVEALRQYEELERILHEAWGERPSERARLALMAELQEPPIATTNGEGWENSGGAMPITSEFYVRREADEQVEHLILRHEGVVLLQGPRQVGKSSLLARVLAFARSAKTQVVLTDVQAMGSSQLLDGDVLYKTLAHSFASQLGLDLDLPSAWSEWLGPNANLDTIMGRILERVDGPVCWAIDEADLLFDKPYTNDFFGLLRSWHNRRALDPAGPFQKLTLLLTYATEAHIFISDLNQSPFNVGVRIGLKDFSESEVRALQTKHRSVPEKSWKTVMEVCNGHPYLTQCGFDFLAKGGSEKSLRESALRQDGPFGSHLNRVLVTISQSPEILSEVKRLLFGDLFTNPTTRYRLQSAGVISISETGAPEFRVPIYESYLRAETL